SDLVTRQLLRNRPEITCRELFRGFRHDHAPFFHLLWMSRQLMFPRDRSQRIVKFWKRTARAQGAQRNRNEIHFPRYPCAPCALAVFFLSRLVGLRRSLARAGAWPRRSTGSAGWSACTAYRPR